MHHIGMITAQHICYDLNLLDSSVTNSLEIGIKTRLSTDMTKNIHKIAQLAQPQKTYYHFPRSLFLKPMFYPYYTSFGINLKKS